MLSASLQRPACEMYMFFPFTQTVHTVNTCGCVCTCSPKGIQYIIILESVCVAEREKQRESVCVCVCAHIRACVYVCVYPTSIVFILILLPLFFESMDLSLFYNPSNKINSITYKHLRYLSPPLTGQRTIHGRIVFITGLSTGIRCENTQSSSKEPRCTPDGSYH